MHFALSNFKLLIEQRDGLRIERNNPGRFMRLDDNLLGSERLFQCFTQYF